MEYYSAVKKDETMNFAGKWKELEKIIQEGQTLHAVFQWRLQLQIFRCEYIACSYYRN